MPFLRTQSAQTAATGFGIIAKVERETILLSQGRLVPRPLHLLGERRFHLEATDGEVGSILSPSDVEAVDRRPLYLVLPHGVANQFWENNGLSQVGIYLKQVEGLSPFVVVVADILLSCSPVIAEHLAEVDRKSCGATHEEQ